MAMAQPWPEARKAVADWHDVAVAAQWASPNAVRATDPTASILANRRIVFDVLGGRYRLIVKMDYEEQKIFVRFFGTHKQYDALAHPEAV